MSDNNRKDGGFSLPDMREMFEQYTDMGEESENEVGLEPENAPEPPAEEVIEESSEKELDSGETVQSEEADSELIPDNIFRFVPPDDLSGEDIPNEEDLEYPTEQAFDDFDMPTDSLFAVNLTEKDRKSLKQFEDDLERAQRENSEKGFKKFIHGIIPMKGDAVSEIVRKIVFMVAIITVVVSSVMLVNTYLIQPNIAESDIAGIKPTEKLPWDKIKEKYPDVDFPEGMQLKYAEAYAQNTDLVGWLTIDKLKMDFPILQTDNDSYYLKRSFTHRYTDLGNPFLACENSVEPLDRNSIIYGHSTRTSDKIFSKLFDYRTTRGFVNNPIIEFNTIYHDYKWKVYAVFITSATTAGDNGYFFNYVWKNLSDESFEKYIAAVDERKLYTTGVDILPTDKILTLSTCLYDFDDARFVVIARLVREGESDEVDVSLVEENVNPRYPQAWYDKNNRYNPYKNAERWYPEK